MLGIVTNAQKEMNFSSIQEQGDTIDTRNVDTERVFRVERDRNPVLHATRGGDVQAQLLC
jgi:hypothetical protein